MNLESKCGSHEMDIASYERSNAMVSKYLELVLRADDAEEGLQELMATLCSELQADRTYIFETQDQGCLSNTWEYCAGGAEPQKQFLQHLKVSDIQSWYDLFEKNESVVVEDTEILRVSEPLIYTYLKPLGISRLIVGRIMQDHKLIGFLGADNPSIESMETAAPVISTIGRIAGNQLLRIDVSRHLQEMELRDRETGFYNQKAMYRHAAYDISARTMGVVYGRIEPQDLKRVPVERLEFLGDRMAELLETGRIYRISQNEFVAVYTNIRENKIDDLRRKVKFSGICVRGKVNIGTAWTDDAPVLDSLLQKARRWSYLCGDANQAEPKVLDPLYRYLEKNHFDLGFFLRSLVEENESGYYFFGDMVNNVYYISDNMARKFGLTGNLIQNLPQFWMDRIKGKLARQRFESEFRKAVDEKKNILDVYHQVITTEGHTEWVRAFAMAKWNPDRTAPLFCAGRLMMQDVSLQVDCATNFNWETVLCRNLSKFREEGKTVRIIGFSLNDIAKVNNMQGRAFGDNLIRNVSEALTNLMSDRLAFYKLSGMRCAAIIRPDYMEQYRDLIREMRKIIESKYHVYGIEVPNPCSFTILDFPREDVGTLDFVEDLNNCVKLAQQEIAAPYVDSRNLDIRKIQESANMALELGRDVLNDMHNFRLMIQPVVATETGEIMAGESLLRWKNDGKNVSPGLFIPILEHENMINRVGRWVLEQSVQICRRIISYKPDFHLSVNVSLQQLDDEGFLEFIGQTLEKYSLDGSHIILEITESLMDKEQEKLMHFVNYCETLGIKVALDDFGTGYSSIRVLMQYPTAIIKLDRSLLLEMGKSADKLNFISSIVFACHQFGKQVVIEGVETKEQCEMVRKAKCDMIQGFYYYRPMEVDDVYRMLAQKGNLIAELL